MISIDCHVRIGGADGTGLAHVSECPTSSTGGNCVAASLLMHITKEASGYFENVWLWTADHDIEDINLAMISVFSARGLLIESHNPVWLWGTSAEHNVLYQYNFYRASHVFAGMIQTESPYFQPSPKIPAPFEKGMGAFHGDPSIFDNGGPGSDSSWALRLIESSDIVIAGAGLYSWFSAYAQQPCIKDLTCQNALVEVTNVGERIYIWNLITM